MTSTAPPWCLHWQPSGELEPSDRHDLFITLMNREGGWTQQILTQALAEHPVQMVCFRGRPLPPLSS